MSVKDKVFNIFSPTTNENENGDRSLLYALFHKSAADKLSILTAQRPSWGKIIHCVTCKDALTADPFYIIQDMGPTERPVCSIFDPTGGAQNFRGQTHTFCDSLFNDYGAVTSHGHMVTKFGALYFRLFCSNFGMSKANDKDYFTHYYLTSICKQNNHGILSLINSPGCTASIVMDQGIIKIRTPRMNGELVGKFNYQSALSTFKEAVSSNKNYDFDITKNIFWDFKSRVSTRIGFDAEID